MSYKIGSRLALLLIILAVTIECRLQVTNFAQMDATLTDTQLLDIPYSIANFGFAPFGKTMIAHLILAPGLDKQCSVDTTKQYPKEIQNSFLLIQRGDCPFVTKAITAQQMGAKMAIIMDNQQHNRGIIMKDNGYGYKVQIPAIFINFKMGQKLVTLLSQTKTKVIMKISFQNIKTEKVDVVLYMQSANRLSYYFVQQFHPFYEKIKKHVNFRLAYDVINCTRCSVDDCYYNGQYCSVNYEHGLSATGKMILDQQIREQVMFDKHFHEWWWYVKCINEECSRISQLQQCSKKCVVKAGVKEQVLAGQVVQTYDYNQDNSVLRKHLQLLRNSGVQSYPAMTINGIKLRGSLNAQFVFDDICNTLTKPPSECSSYVTEQENYDTSTWMEWFVVVLVLLGCAIVFGALFVFCRRVMRKRMTQEMQGRVDDMVSKYIQFYSQRKK